MNASMRWPLSENERITLIRRLAENLPMLRAKLNISQDELSGIIGISRQTYCAIESNKRTMSWQVYLSLILFFEENSDTHNILHHIGAFPDVLTDKGLIEKSSYINNESINSEIAQMLSKLDDQALRSIKTMIMVEYARCSNIPGEAVVRAFDGTEFKKKLTDDEIGMRRAIDSYILSQNSNEK